MNRTVRIPGSRWFSPPPGSERRARAVHFGTAHESLGDLGRDLDDLGREQAVRFAMHLRGRLRRRCAAKAEDLAGALVEPVLVIFDAVLLLRLDIRFVRLRDGFRGGALDFVDVHVHRHGDLRKGDVVRSNGGAFRPRRRDGRPSCRAAGAAIDRRRNNARSSVSGYSTRRRLHWYRGRRRAGCAETRPAHP